MTGRRFTGVRRWALMAASCAVGAALVAGCAGAGGSPAGGAGTSAIGIRGDQGDGGDPVRGGTLSYASYAPVSSLDPTRTQATGATGGSEMAALYDLLVRYDAQSQEYVPQLAESLEESDDGRTWTLRLRPGVTFSDGTRLDARAVVDSITRYNTKRGANNEIWASTVSSTTATDDRTVVFTLGNRWSEFPALLTFGHGMIVAAGSDRGAEFVPIGAGPFTVERFAPQNELVLAARPDYWGGTPNLERLKFVVVQGEQAKLDTLASGGVQMAYLRSADTVETAKADFPGYADFISLSMIGLINHREGRPGTDVRVRQAMAYAVDPAVIDQRARAGKGMPGAEIFQDWSQWHGDVAPIAPDREKARALLADAKSDGFDGTVRYVGVQDPNGEATALAVQAMLKDVGFDVVLDFVNNPTDMVKRLFVDHDYDIALSGTGLLDPAPFVRLYSALYSTSKNNALGVQDPTIDAALDAVKAADSADAKREALGDLQTVFNERVPMLVWGAGANYVPWSEKVFGVKPSMDSIMLFDQAWLAR